MYFKLRNVFEVHLRTHDVENPQYFSISLENSRLRETRKVNRRIPVRRQRTQLRKRYRLATGTVGAPQTPTSPTNLAFVSREPSSMVTADAGGGQWALWWGRSCLNSDKNAHPCYRGIIHIVEMINCPPVYVR